VVFLEAELNSAVFNKGDIVTASAGLPLWEVRSQNAAFWLQAPRLDWPPVLFCAT
jgi:hypothetical protein